MKLSTQDADLFFYLMGSLQFYAKQQLEMLPHVTSPTAYRALEGEQRMKVRNALWENPHLIPAYVQAVLLPFKGVVIYDGLLSSYGITFGSGMRAGLLENGIYQSS